MLFKKKKSEFTKSDSLALCITQWCILQLVPKKFKNQNVFFTQVTESTLPICKIRNDLKAIKGRNNKLIQLEVYFTTLEEWLPPPKNEMLKERPFAQAEILLIKETSGSYIWKPAEFRVEINKYPTLYDFNSFEYNANRNIGYGTCGLCLEMTKKFETFFEKLSHSAP